MDVCSSHTQKSLNSIKESHFIQTNQIKTKFSSVRRRDKTVTTKHSSHILIMLHVTDYHSAPAHSCFSARQRRSFNWRLKSKTRPRPGRTNTSPTLPRYLKNRRVLKDTSAHQSIRVNKKQNRTTSWELFLDQLWVVSFKQPLTFWGKFSLKSSSSRKKIRRVVLWWDLQLKRH